MISRAHGLIISLLLGVASAAAAYAVIGTAHLGDAETKPDVVSRREIARRSHKLDAWEASLRKALAARPPALPALNRYPAVTFVAAPGGASLPAPAPVPTRTTRSAEPAAAPAAKPTTKHVIGATAKAPSKHAASDRTPDEEDRGERTPPVAATAPEHEASAPSPGPAAVVVAAAPTPSTTTPSSSTPPATLSAEQQCRQLLRAAEGKSEQVKQEAERQCEALKQAAEKRG
jgi:hypothetical protein